VSGSPVPVYIWSGAEAIEANGSHANAAPTGTASEVAVMLDDRSDVLGQAHKPAWNEWLRLANLLNLRFQEATVLTYSQLAAPSAAGGSRASTQELPAPATYAEPWASLLEQVVGEAAAALVRDLAVLDVTPPVVGGEAGDGIVVEIAWPGQRLVVDLDLTDDDRHDLVQDGWTVVAPDATAVQKALEPAGAP